jgi:MFS family permease
MKEIRKKILPPILSLFLGTIGNSFFGTLLSLDLKELGFSNLAVGGIVSIYYLGMMLGSWFLEKKILQLGFSKSYFTLIFLNILFIALFPLSTDLSYWYLIRFILGVILGGVFVIVESWILLLAPPEKKGEAMSWYMIGLYSGASLGQFILGDTTKQFPFNVLVPVIACFFGMVVLFFQNQSEDIKQTEDVPKLSTRTVVQLAPLGFFGNLLSGSMLSVFYGLVPLYGKTLELSTHEIGLLMATTIAGGFIGQWPLGRLSDRFSKDLVLVINVFALFFISIPMLFGGNLPFFVMLSIMFIFGILAFTLYPLSINSLCEKIPSNQTMGAVTKGIIAYGIGCVFGPIVAPFFMDLVLKEGLFFYFLLNTALFVILFGKRAFLKLS